MSEVEQVAKAMADTVALNYDHNEAIFVLYARAAIKALDSFRTAEKRRTCQHHSRTGIGCVGANGIGWSRWHCTDCGASYDSEAAMSPANQAPPHD